MMSPRAADDFSTIRARLKELRRESSHAIARNRGRVGVGRDARSKCEEE